MCIRDRRTIGIGNLRVRTIGIGNLRVRSIGIDKLSVHIKGIGNLRLRSIGIDFQYHFFQQNSIRIIFKGIVKSKSKCRQISPKSIKYI